MSDLAAITCFFSYAKNPYAIKRYKEFQENLYKQGVRLYTVELAFFDRDYLLNPVVDWEPTHTHLPIYLKLRSNTVLWHKEALLNILVKKLPPHIKKVAWLDSDIFIQDDDWAEKTSMMLENEELVQIGSKYHFLKESKMDNGDWSKKERSSMNTIGYAYKNLPEKQCDFKHYHIGLGWAANRRLFEGVGLFDYDVTGMGDVISYFSSAKLLDNHEASWIHSVYRKKCPSILPLLSEYDKKCGDLVGGKINYIDTEVIHRYHGPRNRRGYFSRLDLLKGINFNEDLERDSCGLLKWRNEKSNKPFEVFFSMKDEHIDKECDYYGIDKYYDVT